MHIYNTFGATLNKNNYAFLISFQGFFGSITGAGIAKSV
jgi:hypothetical protein